MSNESLPISSGAAGLRALLQRAVALDPLALVRFSASKSHVDVFVTTPFGVLAARRVVGSASRHGAVVKAATLVENFQAPAIDATWPHGALPPTEGFELLDEIPAQVVHQLAEQGRALARQFSGPLGPPSSLLDQTIITVTGVGGQAEIPMRMIFALSSLALIPLFDADLDVPRHLRVSRCGSWVRIDAPFGSVFRNSGSNLLGLMPASP